LIKDFLNDILWSKRVPAFTKEIKAKITEIEAKEAQK